MSNPWDNEISDDLDDDLEDVEYLDDDVEDMTLDDGGDEIIGDDEQLSDDEIAADYAVSDQGVRARSADRGAAMHEATILGTVASDHKLEKKLAGGADVVRIVVHFANGRKLYITP
jgi:hypothetical protein